MQFNREREVLPLQPDERWNSCSTGAYLWTCRFQVLPYIKPGSSQPSLVEGPCKAQRQYDHWINRISHRNRFGVVLWVFRLPRRQSFPQVRPRFLCNFLFYSMVRYLCFTLNYLKHRKVRLFYRFSEFFSKFYAPAKPFPIDSMSQRALLGRGVTSSEPGANFFGLHFNFLASFFIFAT